MMGGRQNRWAKNKGRIKRVRPLFQAAMKSNLLAGWQMRRRVETHSLLRMYRLPA
jgi:hypothetical protein